MQENRVLLVEDDPAIVENLTAFLKGEGFRITAVDGQQKAMEKLEEEAFDLALLDVSLAQGSKNLVYSEDYYALQPNS